MKDACSSGSSSGLQNPQQSSFAVLYSYLSMVCCFEFSELCFWTLCWNYVSAHFKARLHPYGSPLNITPSIHLSALLCVFVYTCSYKTTQEPINVSSRNFIRGNFTRNCRPNKILIKIREKTNTVLRDLHPLLPPSSAYIALLIFQWVEKRDSYTSLPINPRDIHEV